MLIPYSSRLAISMLSRAPLATATMEMNGRTRLIGKSGAAVCTTVTRGVSLPASSPTGTTATASTEMTT